MRDTVFDDVAAYFYESVVTSYLEYDSARRQDLLGQSRDLRLAINAATTLYHFREHIPEKLRKDRKTIAESCPDYLLLGDVVNAAKHGKLTRGNPSIESAQDIFEELLSTQYRDNDGDYWDTRKVVTIKLVDGSQRVLHEVLTNVLNFWSQELGAIGVIAKELHFENEKQVVPPRRSESGAFPLNLEIVQGVRFQMKNRLLKYNPATGEAEPFDLTGAEMHMEVRRPAQLTVVLRNGKTGKEFTRTIEVADNLWAEFQKLGSEEERRLFVSKLANERNVMGEMWEEANRPTEDDNAAK